MNPTNKIIVAAYRRWRHVLFRSLLKTAGDKQLTDSRMEKHMAHMRQIMDAYRHVNKTVLAMACQCEAANLARSVRGSDRDLDNIEIWVCQQLMAVADATQLPEDWNPAVPESWARHLGL